MTETEWLACTDPDEMLKFLGSKGSKRKLRLFACACCRQVSRHIRSRASQHDLEMSELYADRKVSSARLRTAAQNARAVARSLVFEASFMMESRWAARDAACAVMDAASLPLHLPGVLTYVRSVANFTSYRFDNLVKLLRDIVSNPFHLIALDPAWKAWNNGTVVQLAQLAYDERSLPLGLLDSGRLALLADALEDAGCTAPQILEHLRGPGPHVRGCWVVDLFLAKS